MLLPAAQHVHGCCQSSVSLLVLVAMMLARQLLPCHVCHDWRSSAANNL
jgi:hypothetical protein